MIDLECQFERQLPAKMGEIICVEGAVGGLCLTVLVSCRWLNRIRSCNKNVHTTTLQSLYTECAVHTNWHTHTWRIRCSCCLSCSVWIWIFLSLASCSASTRFASCSARSPSSYFSAESCEEHSVVKSQIIHTVNPSTCGTHLPCWKPPPPGLVFWVWELCWLFSLFLFLILLSVSPKSLAPVLQPSPSVLALQYEALGQPVPTTVTEKWHF